MNRAAGSGPGGGTRPAFERLPLLAAGLLSLVIGAMAGLLRAGVAVPGAAALPVATHGPIMIGAFLGTVICLERAVALGARWGYLAPALSAASAVGLWLRAPAAWCAIAQLAAGVLLVAATWRLHRRQPAVHSRVLLVGAASWPLGTLTWLGSGDPGAATVTWAAFLVLTIAAERLELSRFMPRAAGVMRGFALGLALCVVAAVAASVSRRGGEALFGAGCLALAAWLARYDIARRTAGLRGLAGYIGRCLLSGYFWLAAGGLLLLAGTLAQDAPLLRDAALHAVLLGFVIAMVLGHAPVILPAVLRVRIDYHPVFYLPLALLHLSLLVRVAGDLAGDAQWRARGSVGNAVALAAFLLAMVFSVARGARARRSPASSRS